MHIGRPGRRVTLPIAFFMAATAAQAQEATLEGAIQDRTIKAIFLAIAILGVITVFVLYQKKKIDKNKRLKSVLFSIIVLTVALATVYTASSTVYLNSVSHSKGPVHWHADIEVWQCGEKLDLKNPTGISNRIGTSTLHEHGDDRIHLEGVVTRLPEASLGNFLKVVGGELTSDKFAYPTNSGLMEFKDGDVCNGQPGKVQVFVYKIANPNEWKKWEYKRIKLENPAEYVMSPYSNVPPGDCIIIEFDHEKPSTERMCETYEIAMSKGELNGG